MHSSVSGRTGPNPYPCQYRCYQEKTPCPVPSEPGCAAISTLHSHSPCPGRCTRRLPSAPGMIAARDNVTPLVLRGDGHRRWRPATARLRVSAPLGRHPSKTHDDLDRLGTGQKTIAGNRPRPAPCTRLAAAPRIRAPGRADGGQICRARPGSMIPAFDVMLNNLRTGKSQCQILDGGPNSPFPSFSRAHYRSDHQLLRSVNPARPPSRTPTLKKSRPHISVQRWCSSKQ